jgi:hypothetical protein
MGVVPDCAGGSDLKSSQSQKTLRLSKIPLLAKAARSGAPQPFPFFSSIFCLFRDGKSAEKNSQESGVHH